MRAVEWSWDPDPGDTTARTDYALLLRSGELVEHVHDRHVEGLFPRSTWLRLLDGAGYDVTAVERVVADASDETQCDEVFLCARP